MRLILFSFILATAATLVARTPQEHQHPGAQHPATGAHHHPEAAKIHNPVAADQTSIAEGQKLYSKYCSECHGDTGKGDGEMAGDLTPRPPDLTDADWKHGSTDGEMFVVVRDGVKGTGMKSFAKKMTAHQMWDVINYVRSLGPKASH